MFKKVNLALISFFVILTVHYNIGYILFIPITIFYLLKDYKNAIIIYPISLISIIILIPNYIYSTIIILFIILIFLYAINYLGSLSTKKISNIQLHILIYFFIFLINEITLELFFDQNFIINLILSIISVLLYIFFESNLIKIIKMNKDMTRTYSIGYLEVMIYLITVLGAASINISKNINIGIIVGILVAMLMSKKYQNIFSFIYSILASILLVFLTKEASIIFIIITSAFYLLPHAYAFLIYNIFLSLIIIFNYTLNISIFNNEIAYLYLFITISIVFELLTPLMLNKKLDNKKEFDTLYTQIMKNFNNEITTLSLFLDHFTSVFQNPKNYNKNLSDGIKIILSSYCDKCEKQKECFEKYREKLYPIFQNILLNKKNNSDIYVDLKNNCSKLYMIETKGKELNKKIDYDKKEETNNGLIAQIISVSNALKKYSIELITKEEISYYDFNNLKYRLIDYGIEIDSYEIKKVHKRDFLIEIELIKKEYKDNILDIIKTICQNTLKEQTSVLIKKEEDKKLIINIVPILNINVIYGYGSLSSEKNSLCGDNFLLKNLNNGIFIAAISDGMGKGYSAFCDSSTTLKLVDDVTNLNIDATKALEMLNSFYIVQDYFEKYATLDLIEINRINSTATFHKMGASTTYIVNKNKNIKKILNKSLPFGVDEEVPVEEVKLEKGDLILMSSDGIFENIMEENLLEEYVKSIIDLPPQKIAYEIINYTLKNNIKTKDDMSIIALKISESFA